MLRIFVLKFFITDCDFPFAQILVTALTSMCSDDEIIDGFLKKIFKKMYFAEII